VTLLILDCNMTFPCVFKDNVSFGGHVYLFFALTLSLYLLSYGVALLSLSCIFPFTSCPLLDSLCLCHTDPAIVIARLQQTLAAASVLLQRVGRSGDSGTRLQRSFENLSIDVLRLKVFVLFLVIVTFSPVSLSVSAAYTLLVSTYGTCT